jgi:tetratricopeptide (TPR) repeat protein
MNKLFRRILCLTALLILSSCSWMGSDEVEVIEKGPTLADLEPAVIPEKDTSLPKVDLNTLIDIYSDVLTVTTEPELQIQVLQRLAGLEMRRGEDKLFDAQEGGQFDLAISAYKRLLEQSPDHEKSDQLMYQLSKAYDLSGDMDQSMVILDQAVEKHPDSIHYAEAQFRRAEIFFAMPDYQAAELAYGEVIKQGQTTVHYKNALYMHGWSLFKQQRYRDSLRSFIGVLDLSIVKGSRVENLGRGDRELTLDVLRVMSVVFSYLDGATTIAKVFDELGDRHYMPVVYAQLGKLYLDKERYRDSAEAYRAFIEKFPSHDESPVLYAKLIDAYIAGAFSDEVLQEKEKYITYYGIRSDFWAQKTTNSRNYIRPYLKQYLPELARHYHAKAQGATKVLAAGKKTSKKTKPVTAQSIKARYLKAGDYYSEFIDTFPVDEQVPEMRFLLAESRFEAGEYEAAIEAYEIVAYRHANNKRSTEAGYAAIVAYGKLLSQLNQANPVDNDKVDTWLRLKIDSQLRFANTYFDDKRADSVLAKSSEELLELKEYRQAFEAAELLVRKQPPATKALRKTAWLVIGLSQFELEQYAQSEMAYQETLKLMPAKDPGRKDIVERLAATVYKQGEMAMTSGNQIGAAEQFLRVASVAPASKIGVTAQFDAANAFLAASSWDQAINVLNRFRRANPNNKLSADIPAKLVVAYQGSGQLSRAADELTSIYKKSNDEGVKRESLYQAAELYEQAGDITAAIDRYRTYAHSFADPFPVAMEARFKLSELYLSQKEESKRRFWLKKMIAADTQAGSKRTDRSRYLGAFSSTVFANDHYESFRSIPLKLPLRKSLKRKKQALNKALTSYKSVSDYGVQEFATLATYRIASIYQKLSSDLLASERPKGLDELALEEYGILLEEQAFPFEEKSISIHETNAQRSWKGTYDDWIKESFSSLKKLLPARYGKDEGGMTFDNEIY